jgi:hypothetical protein
MNRTDFLGSIRNYNGKGNWSVSAVQTRYREYCTTFHFESFRSIEPFVFSQGDVHWIYPIMTEVIRGIEEGDVACIALGVDFVEEDAHFPFGPKLKSNAARALRRSDLNEAQKARLRQRISTMLASGTIPHEMRVYAKLLRTIGVGEHWPRLERDIPRENPYAMRFYKSLRAAEGLPV